MISQLLPFLKNVQAGPKTTVMGAIIMGLGGYLLATSDDTIVMIMDSGLIGVGFICFFLKDWQKGLKENKKKNDESEEI